MNGWHATIKTIWGERMAERRMFAKTIVLSDAFLDMPATARCLYFTLAMFADDDGFVNSPRGIMRQCGASDGDMQALLDRKFVLLFDSGVIVIKHWRIHNYIQKDRYKPTKYQDEYEYLTTDENGGYKLDTNCIQTVSKMDTQVRLGEDSQGKDKDKAKRFIPPTIDEVRAYCEERKNNVSAERFMDYYTSNGWMVGRNKMKDWKACVRSWEKNQFSSSKKNQSVPDYMYQEEKPKEKVKRW